MLHEVLGKEADLLSAPAQDLSWYYKHDAQLYPEHLNQIVVNKVVKRIHTKKLLRMLHNFHPYNAPEAIFLALSRNGFYYLKTPYYVTKDILKIELATRPHIPNKLEAKAIRQAKAKQAK